MKSLRTRVGPISREEFSYKDSHRDTERGHPRPGDRRDAAVSHGPRGLPATSDIGGDAEQIPPRSAEGASPADTLISDLWS